MSTGNTQEQSKEPQSFYDLENGYTLQPNGDAVRNKIDMFFRDCWSDFGYEFGLGIVNGANGTPIAVAEKIVCKQSKAGDMVPALVKFDRDDVQQLMDKMWSFGIRPSDMRNKEVPTETLKAMQENINDLRGERDYLRALTKETIKLSLASEKQKPMITDIENMQFYRSGLGNEAKDPEGLRGKTEESSES
jgi:hypothetical protein